MKKLTILVSSTILLSSLSMLSFAGENGGGCGVGKMVMEGKEGKDAQMTAAILNNSTGIFQWFGMTSGTLGCDVSQQVNNEHQREKFFAENEDSLSIEMARGNGDHLISLASIMGIPSEKQEDFFSLLQENYGSIITADDMLASIDSTLLGDTTFGQFVQ